MENLKWTSKNNWWKLQCNPPRERNFGSKIRSSKNRRWHRITPDLVTVVLFHKLVQAWEIRESSELPCSMFALRATAGTKWCVGRESNPGQLLGRQLCSPLYHRRRTWRRTWRKKIQICVKDYKLKRHFRNLFYINVTFQVQLRQLLKIRENLWRQKIRLRTFQDINGFHSTFIHVRLCPIMLNVRNNRFLKWKKRDDHFLTDNCGTKFVFLTCLFRLPWSSNKHKVIYESKIFRKTINQRVGGIVVSIAAFQAVDPGSIPGRRSVVFALFFVE